MPQDQASNSDMKMDGIENGQSNSSSENSSTGSIIAGLLSALLAGGITYGLLQMFYPVFSIPQELMDRVPPGPLPPAVQAELTMAKKIADGQNAVLFVGLLGALVTGMMAIGAGISNKYCNKILLRATACLFIGALLGCLAGGLGHLVNEFIRHDSRLTPLSRTILSQAAMLATLGMGIGFTYGNFAKKIRSSAPLMTQGLLAGLLAALIYPIAIALIYPAANTSVIIPKEPTSRLVWIGIAVAIMGLLIPASFGKRTSTNSDSDAA